MGERRDDVLARALATLSDEDGRMADAELWAVGVVDPDAPSPYATAEEVVRLSAPFSSEERRTIRALLGLAGEARHGG